MNPNEHEVIDSPIDTEPTANEDEIVLDDEPAFEDMDTLKKKIQTLEAQKDHWKKKATAPKAEVVKAEEKSSTKSDLTTKDLYALMEAKVAQDDISEVEKYARFEGITVAEALKSPIVKTLLREKSEQRNVALATNTGNARRSSNKISDDDILNNASNGKLPEDASALAEARMRARKAK